VYKRQKYNKQVKQTCEFHPAEELIKEGKYNQIVVRDL